MKNDPRLESIARALHAFNLDAVVCSLPRNILALSGYWPIVGTSIAIATARDVVLLVPEDEADLARSPRAWPSAVSTFSPGSLEALISASEAARAPLASLIADLGLERARIGFDGGEGVENASYVAMHLYGSAMQTLLAEAAPAAAISPGDRALAAITAFKTPEDIARIRFACSVAMHAYADGEAALVPGITEHEAAFAFRKNLVLGPDLLEQTNRADGYVACMSGSNSGRAYGSHARSTSKKLFTGELALVHCNSHVEGYFTDLTRTYSIGPPGELEQRMHDAINDARIAALDRIRPGARASEVDRVVRDTLVRHGFDGAMKHGTGHGVGFEAIDHRAIPRLHPASLDLLEPGMIFNVEPGLYFEGRGGMRHCDVVLLAEDRLEVLT